MDILKDYEDIALSDKQLRRLVHGKASIILYPNLVHYKNIDEVLGPHGACFLLFEAKRHYGHWTLLFKTINNTIEFFNPYGGFPDDSLDYIPMHYRKKSNQFHTHLSELLHKSPYELEYNEFQFQKKNRNTKTCGRWCAVRLLMRYMTLYQFKEMIDLMTKLFNITGDELVTLLTMSVNEKGK
jgi:hypothetical protein